MSILTPAQEELVAANEAAQGYHVAPSEALALCALIRELAGNLEMVREEYKRKSHEWTTLMIALEERNSQLRAVSAERDALRAVVDTALAFYKAPMGDELSGLAKFEAAIAALDRSKA